MTNTMVFKKLHTDDKPFVVGNVWNPQSAKIYEKLGYKALATSSSAIAHSLGYEDGENIPFNEYLYIIERILQSISSGNFVNEYIYQKLEEKGREIINVKSFSPIFV